MYYNEPWTVSAALAPIFSTTLAIAFALYILAYPPRRRQVAFLILCVPVAYAFKYQLRLTPWFSVNDTFGRFLYIWLANMSHAILLVEFAPEVASGQDNWRNRLRKAYKVLFVRRLSPVPKFRQRPPHDLSWTRFCIHHLLKAGFFFTLSYSWDKFIDTPSSYKASSFEYDHASFIRRLPQSFNAEEIRTRFMMTFSVCVSDMLYFSTLHSLFAVLFVNILCLDDPAEWDLSLFGTLKDCWSVRRYWGVYWHDYVYDSFSAHTKIVTRNWLGLCKPSVQRRLLENSMVFAVSGLMHSAVRWAQTNGEGEVWSIAIWYSAQMLPIIFEGGMQKMWSDSALRLWLEENLRERSISRIERAVGRAWVFCWMFWSVPKYMHTRNAWEKANLRRKYPEYFAARSAELD